jgi:ABC-type branched-subunit amino acid transport system ATPase component
MSAPRLLLLDDPRLALAPAIVEQLFQTIVALAQSGDAVCLAGPTSDRPPLLA